MPVCLRVSFLSHRLNDKRDSIFYRQFYFDFSRRSDRTDHFWNIGSINQIYEIRIVFREDKQMFDRFKSMRNKLILSIEIMTNHFLNRWTTPIRYISHWTRVARRWTIIDETNISWSSSSSFCKLVNPLESTNSMKTFSGMWCLPMENDFE